MRTLRRLRDVVTSSKSMSAARTPGASEDPAGKHIVLILSSDAVAAALLGALVETLGYLVRFYHPPESPGEVLRREKPSVAMVDCADPTVMNDELLGRAKMRGISVVIFGTSDALRRVRELALEHELDSVVMPVSVESLDESLRKAVEDYC